MVGTGGDRRAPLATMMCCFSESIPDSPSVMFFSRLDVSLDICKETYFRSRVLYWGKPRGKQILTSGGTDYSVPFFSYPMNEELLVLSSRGGEVMRGDNYFEEHGSIKFERLTLCKYRPPRLH